MVFFSQQEVSFTAAGNVVRNVGSHLENRRSADMPWNWKKCNTPKNWHVPWKRDHFNRNMCLPTINFSLAMVVFAVVWTDIRLAGLACKAGGLRLKPDGMKPWTTAGSFASILKRWLWKIVLGGGFFFLYVCILFGEDEPSGSTTN